MQSALAVVSAALRGAVRRAPAPRALSSAVAAQQQQQQQQRVSATDAPQEGHRAAAAPVRAAAPTVESDANSAAVMATPLSADAADEPMAEFSAVLPGSAGLLRVLLRPGAAVLCAPGCVVGRSATVGLALAFDSPLRAVQRRLSGGPLVMQELAAVGGAGDVLLAPRSLGQVVITQLDGTCDLYLRPATFLASADTVKLRGRVARLSASGVTGLTVLRAKGRGPLAFTGFGAVAKIALAHGEEYIVSAEHVVAWDGTVRTSPLVREAPRSSLMSRLFSSEARTWRMIGPGRVFVRSRLPQRRALFSFFEQTRSASADVAVEDDVQRATPADLDAPASSSPASAKSQQ